MRLCVDMHFPNTAIESDPNPQLRILGQSLMVHATLANLI